MTTGIRYDEQSISQNPAIEQLKKLGYQTLSDKEVLEERLNDTGNVLLENILRSQLQKLNKISYKGGMYEFSEININEAIRRLKNIKDEGLIRTNHEVYDLLTLGTTLEQSMSGKLRNFSLNYIDWDNPENNVYHVVSEFSVDRANGEGSARPDIVLFVNGIPFVVIECKSSTIDLEQAVSQNIRNQSEDFIPKLFRYVQLILAVNSNFAKYATVGTSMKFWSVWKDLEDTDEDVKKTSKHATEQAKIINGMCRPERLLDLTYNYTVFDAGEKKITRYQQFFVIRSILKKVSKIGNNGKRDGGTIWQTQGSGKSLTMVMLTRAIIRNLDLPDARVILVTDREDLDKQLGGTFMKCGDEVEQATSGRDLVRQLREKTPIITTLIHKFDRGFDREKYIDESPDIFVLVDESHRTNFGTLASKMRQMVPNACYLGFTGTPLVKKDKNNFKKFGKLIEPSYSVRQAIKDKAVLPLLYEGRYVEIEQDKKSIDLWFDRHTANLTDKQKADLKKKYARAKVINETEQVVYMRAFDISEHYKTNWKGTGFKAQLVAPTKATALKYHEYLEEIGGVTSEVIISAPDNREGYEEIDDEPVSEVSKFWQKMMKRFGSEEEYTKEIIKEFKEEDEPEILITVDKLLTGFDAPRNTVLYLCRTLREHTLLQAIARVNRVCDEKEYGYVIDYASVLGELDKALTTYDALSEFDEEDVSGYITSINDEIKKLPEKHAELLKIFQDVSGSDNEAFEVFLSDNETRTKFYETLSDYSKVLGIAMSSEKFLMKTEDKILKKYKFDLKRFQNLKNSAKLRYADTITYKDYDLKIKKLLDTHIKASDIVSLNDPVDIFDEQSFEAIKNGQGIFEDKSEAARADAMAYATKRVIDEKMDEDPAFYEKFSRLIQMAIDNFKNNVTSSVEYLEQTLGLSQNVKEKYRDDMPDSIIDNDEACAFYGVIIPHLDDSKASEEIAAKVALFIQNEIKANWKIDFWNDAKMQNKMKNKIEDFLYENKSLSYKNIDEIITQTINIARCRSEKSG